VTVHGLIGRPAAARASAKWQYLLLNGRYVRDRSLSHAIREAYRGLLPPSRWPVVFVFLDVPPGDVDVNVHPTKIEVRFRNASAVYGELLAVLRDTLNHANLTPDVALADPAAEPDVGADARRASIREAIADFFKSAPPPQPRLTFPPDEPGPRRAPGEVRSPAAAATAEPLYRPVAAAPAPAAPPVAAAPAVPHRPALQVHDSYIVTDCPEGLLIVDQHALHERLLFNELTRRLAAGSLDGQRMLIPETLTVTAAEAATLERHGELLGRLGLEVAPFGPDTVAIQSFPTLLAERSVAPAAFVRELLDSLGEAEPAEPEQLLEGLLETMACKAAVKAGDPLTTAEMDELLARRGEAEKGSACPHGRPTSLVVSLADLARQFKRT
jgi:DNA mismatch repair protein MutL